MLLATYIIPYLASIREKVRASESGFEVCGFMIVAHAHRGLKPRRRMSAPIPAFRLLSRSIALPRTGSQCIAGQRAPRPLTNRATRAFATAPAASWNRLIRFVPAGSSSGQWVYGEPMTLEKDGSLPADLSNVKARIVKPGEGGDVFGEGCMVTDEVVSVGKVRGSGFEGEIESRRRFIGRLFPTRGFVSLAAE